MIYMKGDGNNGRVPRLGNGEGTGRKERMIVGEFVEVFGRVNQEGARSVMCET